MDHKSKLTPVMLGVVLVGALLGGGGCGRAVDGAEQRDAAAAVKFAEGLQRQIAVEAMMGHLQKLQGIADDHGGNRAIGTPGYDASVNYVADTLRGRGFDVQIQDFTARIFKADKGSVSLGDKTFQANALQFSLGTAPEGVTGPLVAAPDDDDPGCTASDYDGLPVQGAVVLVDRGSCPFKEKMAIAVESGAVAMIVADNVDEPKMGGTLGEKTEVKIPVVGVTKADGALLRGQRAGRKLEATIKLDAHTDEIESRNVIAQTKTGSTDNVVMLGAHLDSVPEGPGINDNGTGVAAVLETALQLGESPQVRNAVRFGFWGAEELGLIGSTRYLESLSVDELKDIALYLNFDMLGSPNPGYFTYDGDQSMPPDKRGQPVVPEGSAGIERTLDAYLKSVGKTARDTTFDGRSDYDGFTQAGIPAGGLFSGAEAKKSAEEAKLWGGEADAPFDPNYHQKGDTIEHIDRDELAVNGPGVGYATGLYAQDLGGRNGVPAREDRTRHAVTKP